MLLLKDIDPVKWKIECERRQKERTRRHRIEHEKESQRLAAKATRLRAASLMFPKDVLARPASIKKISVELNCSAVHVAPTTSKPCIGRVGHEKLLLVETFQELSSDTDELRIDWDETDDLFEGINI